MLVLQRIRFHLHSRIWGIRIWSGLLMPRPANEGFDRLCAVMWISLRFFWPYVSQLIKNRQLLRKNDMFDKLHHSQKENNFLTSSPIHLWKGMFSKRKAFVLHIDKGGKTLSAELPCFEVYSFFIKEELCFLWGCRHCHKEDMVIQSNNCPCLSLGIVSDAKGLRFPQVPC